MKQKRLLIGVCIVVAGALLTPLTIHFVTWGFPWELPKAKEITQRYLNDTYYEPMEIVGANRFLRGEYNIIVRDVTNGFTFTVSLGSDKTFWKDDYYEKKTAHELVYELNAIVKSYHRDSYAWVNFVSAYFCGDNAITALTSETTKKEQLNNNFHYIVRYSQNIDANNYIDNLQFFLDCIIAVQKFDYEGKDISFISTESKVDSFRDGKVSQLELVLARDEYMEITEPSDIIPYLEKAIVDNPYYQNH